MRLRPGRAPVTRLSRKVIVVLALILAVAIAAALFLALRPGLKIDRTELYGTDNRTTPDGLSNLPRDYAGLPRNVPPLGPPLPGDLGRPILNAGTASGATPPDPEKQRIAQEQEAARLSRLFATTNVRQSSSVTPISANVAGRHDGPTGDLASRIESSRFSTATSIAARSAATVSKRRRVHMFSRLALSSRRPCSPACARTCPAR